VTAKTTSSDVRALVRRAIEFERWCNATAAGRVEDVELGQWLRSDEHPRMWVLNELHVIGPHPELTGEQLLAELDRELGDVPGRHRRAVVEDDLTGQRLAGDLRGARGWNVGPVGVMVLLGNLPEPAPDVAREASEEDFRALDVAITAAGDTPPDDHEVVVAGHARLREATGARRFIGRRDGVDACRTTLFTDGTTGQPEAVETLPDHRGHGLAAATVTQAGRAALDSGCDFVFLVCDLNDGPVQLYASLGFVVIGRYWTFTRPG
jgi:GNAT superfamily N-acetyltransferase